ncbi:hypothetical protein ASZ78_004938 [Callipepla squamata]|uniref:VWFD domain-containing protein n=1 Tax=Callipepla squamata TaxID=9009 RepID=A0A226MEP7_CALSU|nr:hypothetical protein ASZ78_004938 [Callipepla squamata]
MIHHVKARNCESFFTASFKFAASNPAHNGRVCSTWGNFHFKTFDGDIFHHPGLCNYVFASHCNAVYEEFNIQIRRTLVKNVPRIQHITLKLEGIAVELAKDLVLINSKTVQLPYSQAGITIVRSSIYVKVVSKTDIVFMWNQRDSILLELHEKYANQTCGLCGDFNGIPVYNEFYSNNIRLTALQFGNMQKMDGPTEYCEDPTPSPPDNCTHNFQCEDEIFTILVELRKCGVTDTETCLKTVTFSLNKGQTLIEVKPDGGVFVNSIYTQLPISAANVTIFRPSSFFIIMHTNMGIQVEIQITPIMQVFVRLDPVFKNQTCGLCGNFNNVQADDFKAMSGVVEGTAAAFANTWKTQATCPDIQGSFENPCALSIDNAKYTTSCPKSLSYSYTISSCQPTCRSLSEPDVTCKIQFVPVDGCTCINGTYMDESGKCVPAKECPCYYRGSPIPLGEVVHENGLVCTCIQGRLNCIGTPDQIPVCESPMFYLNCTNNTSETTGAECQKSCQTLDMQCYSTQCVSGCVCPSGLVSDGNGGCIPEEECPCIHNGATYQPGEKIDVDCNTCVCKDRKWECTKKQCLGTCAVYGDGHYTTFDDKSFSFNGNCEYTLVQVLILNKSQLGFFLITFSLFQKYELILSEEQVSVIKRGQDGEVPFTVRYIGMYTVIDTTSGLILMWDKKTSIFIKLSADFKGQICGLCGNYDGNGINDFTTRSLSVVENVLEFGNSWKVSSTCPDATSVQDPCSTNPYRKSWSEKQCSIINSNVFAACHSQVEPAKYYQACVTDACACDSGGDCDCFCTAVAAYAQACNEVGVCIAWRTPSICREFYFIYTSSESVVKYPAILC